MGKRAVTEIGGNHVRMKDQSEWFVIPGHHAAIVEKAAFDQAQANIRHFKSEKKNRKEYPLRGKVFCGCCNHAMHRSRKDPVYTCRFTKIAESFGCNGHSIKESELEALLFVIILKQAEAILGLDNVSNAGELETKLSEQSAYERQIRECKDAKMCLYEQYLTGEIDTLHYKEQKTVHDAKLVDLKRHHSALASQTAQKRLEDEEKANQRAVAQDVVRETSLTQTLAETLIDKIKVYPDNRIEIAWKIRDFAETAIDGNV